jgi:hypothetical protein
MVVSDVGKLAFLVVVTLGMFALVFTGESEFADVDQWLTLVVGYLFGNGVNAVRKRAPSPVILPSVETGAALTVNGPLHHYETSEERDEYDSYRDVREGNS